jgi:hypothetical protein
MSNRGMRGCIGRRISSLMTRNKMLYKYAKPMKGSWPRWSKLPPHPKHSPRCFPRFARVTASYWPGLFHCYDHADLPRTNNELEQYFGSARYHERRASGRKQASPGLVVRGAVRIVASVASRLYPFSGVELCPTDLARWRTLRSELNNRHEARRMQHRFRKSPEKYLADLEEKLIKERLLL